MQAVSTGCSSSQVEYCDKPHLSVVVPHWIISANACSIANRTIGQPNKITVIFGRKVNKHYRGKAANRGSRNMDLPQPGDSQPLS